MLAEVSTINTPRSQIYINIPHKDLDLNFEVIKKADNSTYGDGNEIRLSILGPIALFRNFILTTCSGKHLEDFSDAHSVFFFNVQTKI